MSSSAARAAGPTGVTSTIAPTEVEVLGEQSNFGRNQGESAKPEDEYKQFDCEQSPVIVERSSTSACRYEPVDYKQHGCDRSEYAECPSLE
jgi:hypothetical protein